MNISIPCASTRTSQPARRYQYILFAVRNSRSQHHIGIHLQEDRTLFLRKGLQIVEHTISKDSFVQSSKWTFGRIENG